MGLRRPRRKRTMEPVSKCRGQMVNCDHDEGELSVVDVMQNDRCRAGREHGGECVAPSLPTRSLQQQQLLAVPRRSLTSRAVAVGVVAVASARAVGCAGVPTAEHDTATTMPTTS